MNKTAMQELIRQCESVLKDGVALSGEDAIKAVICSAKELLPTERQQIEDVSLKFLEWHKQQPPNALCTVHPPAGSGSGYGLYALPINEVFDKFYSKTYENGGL